MNQSRASHKTQSIPHGGAEPFTEEELASCIKVVTALGSDLDLFQSSKVRGCLSRLPVPSNMAPFLSEHLSRSTR